MQHLTRPARLPVRRPAGRLRWRLFMLPAVLLAPLGLLIGPRAWAVDITSCPYTITAPGDYHVTQDLSCSSDTKPAIEIATNNVTLSLDGHTITGPGNSVGVSGIAVSEHTGVVVSDGTISDFGGAGVSFVDTGGSSVSGVTVRRALSGISLTNVSTGDTITSNTVTNCTVGIFLADNASGNTVNSNAVSGCTIGMEIAGSNNQISGNTTSGNATGISIIGPGAGTGNTVEGNTALGNELVDLDEGTVGCLHTTWSNNCFGTANQSCIGTSICAGPQIFCPSDQTVTAPSGHTSATVGVGLATTVPAGLGVAGTRDDSKALTDPYPVGATHITWFVTSSSHPPHCTQTITVQLGSGPPALTCPGNQVVTAASQNGAAVTVGMATSTTEDAMIIGVRSDGLALTASYPVGTTTITWMATVDERPPSTCTQTIVVLPAYSRPFIVIGPASADPHVESIFPDRGPLYQRAIIHGHGFADVQGTSYVLLGDHQVPVLNWTAVAIDIVVNPLGYHQTPLALNTAYPVQVVTPAAGKRSNTVDFFLTDGPPADYPNPAVSGPSDQPSFAGFQRSLFCAGDTVALMGAGFGFAQGTGYVSVTVPLMDPSGNVVQQVFAEPVLAWSENAINFLLALPAGAIPGTYTATVHRGNGKTASGSFIVGAVSDGKCAVPAD